MNQEPAGGAPGGASISIKDPRVSSFASWAMSIIGTLIAVSLAFCANNLWQLNLTMRDVLAANEATKASIGHINVELNDHETRIRQLEGKTFRGVSGYPQESVRGRN